MNNGRLAVGLLVIIFFVVVLFVVLPIQQRSDEEYVQTWADTHGNTVVKIERCYFSTGPYWFRGKNDRIYRAETEAGAFWFRFRLFHKDVEPGN